MSINVVIARQRLRERNCRKEHRSVGMDQSFSNFAMVLFVEGVPTDRVVFHTGNPMAKKHKDKTYGHWVTDDNEQLAYISGMVLNQLLKWNANELSLEGLSFGSSGNVERQLGGLFFGMQVMIHRELLYPFSKIHVVTPTQAKNLAQQFLIGDDRWAKDKVTGEILYLKKKGNPPQKNKMKKKAEMHTALKNTPYGWLTDGYGRDTGSIKARSVESGIEDIPDAFWIGAFTEEKLFGTEYKRPEQE